MTIFNVQNIVQGIYLLRYSVPEIHLNNVVFEGVRNHFKENIELQNRNKVYGVYNEENCYYLFGVKIIRHVKPLDKAFSEIDKWRR